jgi:hypothetical protein
MRAVQSAGSVGAGGGQRGALGGLRVVAVVFGCLRGRCTWTVFLRVSVSLVIAAVEDPGEGSVLADSCRLYVRVIALGGCRSLD